MCEAFATTPDIASRLLSPSLRPLTVATMEYQRAMRVTAEFRRMHASSDEDEKAMIAERWRAQGDGPFFAELSKAVGNRPRSFSEL